MTAKTPPRMNQSAWAKVMEVYIALDEGATDRASLEIEELVADAKVCLNSDFEKFVAGYAKAYKGQRDTSGDAKDGFWLHPSHPTDVEG